MGLFSRLTKADIAGLERAVDALSDELVALKRGLKRKGMELVNTRARLKRIEDFLAATPQDEPEDDDSEDETVTQEDREVERLRLRNHG